MLFNSPIFIFLFLAITLGTYFLCHKRLRNLVLLAFSVVFYSFGEPIFVLVVIASAVVDWFIGFRIGDLRLSTRSRKVWLVVAVCLNLAVLVFFKYTNFLVNDTNLLLRALHWNELTVLQIALPIGVSFVAFEKITYLVDIWRGQNQPEGSIFRYLLYVFFFPKLLAGPIIKYHEISDQIKARGVRLEDLTIGFSRFSFGLAKKVFIADTMGEVADFAFKIPIDQLPFTTAWLGIIAYTLQIYFDFSGYSDMAIGLARVFGFRIRENFPAVSG